MAKEENVKYNYQYDSVARAYTQPAEPIRVPTPNGPKSKSKISVEPKLDIAFGAQMTLCGIILFASSLLYVHTYASLRSQQVELNNLKSQKIAITDKIATVEAQITEKMDLDEIRQRAIEELGMQKPLAYQIVYVDMPEQSYTTYHQEK